MMFYMNSKVLEKYFLQIEYDQDILDAQYVLVSCRVRVSDAEKYDNILNAKDNLFPDPEVCSALDEDTFRERYFSQLSQNLPLISYLIKASIEEKFNIIFLCSEKEDKIGYLKLLSEFIFMEFNGYPVYNYKKYCQNKTDDIIYNKKLVLKICNSYIDDAKKQSLDNITEREIKKDIKELSKDSLIKELKRYGLYKKGMSKSTMRDLLKFEFDIF